MEEGGVSSFPARMVELLVSWLASWEFFSFAFFFWVVVTTLSIAPDKEGDELICRVKGCPELDKSCNGIYGQVCM